MSMIFGMLLTYPSIYIKDKKFTCNSQDDCPMCGFDGEEYYFISECVIGICKLCSKVMYNLPPT